MGRFLRGILLGIGVALLVAPMRGEQLRRLLNERLQQLLGYVPEKAQLNEYTQQVSGRVSQTASELKDYATQAAAQVKDTASNLGAIAQQAGASTKDTASDIGTVAQQAGSDLKSTVNNLSSTAQDAAQQATAKVKDTVSTLSSTAQDVAQQATTKAKDTASTLSTAAQQATAKVQDTASTVSNTVQDKVQQATAKVQDTAGNIADTTKQAAVKTQQNVQSSTSATVNSAKSAVSSVSTSSTDNLIATIPGIEPEIQAKLEAQGIQTTPQLLEQTNSKEERAILAQKAEMSTHMLKMLADRADLMRLQGVTADVATLLEEAGVGGTKDLRRRNPEHLYATLLEAQSSGKSAYTTPGLDQITQWIAEAMAITSQE